MDTKLAGKRGVISGDSQEYRDIERVHSLACSEGTKPDDLTRLTLGRIQTPVLKEAGSVLAGQIAIDGVSPKARQIVIDERAIVMAGRS